MIVAVFWHFLHLFFVMVTCFSTTTFRVAFFGFLWNFQVTMVGVVFWNPLQSERVVTSRTPGETRAGIKLLLSRRLNTSHSFTTCAVSCTWLLCDTVILLKAVRCQDWSAVPWAGERTLYHSKALGVFVLGPSTQRDPVMLLTWQFWPGMLSEQFGTFPVTLQQHHPLGTAKYRGGS